LEIRGGEIWIDSGYFAKGLATRCF
jgi:hypothetical protein